MDRTHLAVLSHLDFEGKGKLLKVGSLSIRAVMMILGEFHLVEGRK